MADSLSWSAICLPVLVGLGSSFLLERLLDPAPLTPLRRALSATGLHIGTWLLIFTTLLALSQRPWFSMAWSMALQLFLVFVNNVKFDTLKEPFLVQDFDYFWDMIKHPRLYIPFFGLWRTLFFSIGALTLLVFGLMLEVPMTALLPFGQFIGLLALLATVTLLLLYAGIRTIDLHRFSPSPDLVRLGQFGFFWGYAKALLQQKTIRLEHSPFISEAASVAPQPLPHLVVVQSESFFDPRAMSPDIRNDLLAAYDEVIATAESHGRLDVPAWGANTVRTECAFLTGLPPDDLGVHAFSPYRYLARHSLPNLAGYLRTLGYRTLCVHPYPASFYLRDKVFPRLGFDQFIDIRQFPDQQKSGQYIGDQAVARKVLELLDQSSAEPLFIFVITMENHGPLHLENVPAESAGRFCDRPLPAGCHDLEVYLGHIHNADRMIEQLTSRLKEERRGGVLSWYGDHVPIMPRVYRTLGEVDGRTDYFIWDSRQTGIQRLKRQDLPVHTLAARLLDALFHRL